MGQTGEVLKWININDELVRPGRVFSYTLSETMSKKIARLFFASEEMA
jgi:hypothetical protein